MYKQCDYNRCKTERGLLLLDAMDNLGSGAGLGTVDDSEKEELLREVLELIEGTKFEVVNGRTNETVTIDTANMFFICFGVNNDNLANADSVEFLGSNKDHASSEAIDARRGHSLSYKSLAFDEDTSRVSYYDEDDDSDNDSDDSFEGLKANRLAQLLIESKQSPIPKFQSLWGMKDVEVKIAPEALEVIANQVREKERLKKLLHMCQEKFV